MGQASKAAVTKKRQSLPAAANTNAKKRELRRHSAMPTVDMWPNADTDEEDAGQDTQ